MIGDARGLGFLMGVELVKSLEGREPADDLAQDVFYRCLDKGLSFKTTMGNTLTLTPPLVTKLEEMDLAPGVIDDVIGEAGRV